ncbi:hypothetical protein [Nitrogeniibacter aestuarii]|uniref:hypothetical protein n=1 Tax=Nitrogeniibacter aestuarii TaxID=2815343 RepID=UPI001D11A6BE|nr:hypothetical protein [Nitrogeniibacter aestuarii]
MPQRHLLYLDASAMHCFYWKQGHLRLIERFPVTEPGIDGFVRHVQTYRKAIFSLLVDVMEEGFQFEVLPHVSGQDRTAMLKRKTDQAFFGSPLSAAISLGRERTGRRDERFLFVALTRQAAIDPWLDVLRANEVALSGIHTPPLVLDTIFKRLRGVSDNRLLVNFTPGGMRQTFFEHGRVRFSRLAQSLDDIPIGLEDQCAAEILKTHSYLAGQRLIPRNVPLTVQLMVDDADYKRLRPALRESAELHFEHLPVNLVASKLGLAQEPRGSSALPVLLQCLARETGIAQLATPTDTRFFGIWRMRQGLVGAAVAIFFAAMLYAGKVWFDGQQMLEAAVAVRQSAQIKEAQLQRLETERPQLDIPATELRDAIKTLRELEQAQVAPESWFLHLSRALDQHPDVQLERIDWQIRTDASTGLSAGVAALSLPESSANDRRGMLDEVGRFLDDLGAGTSNGAKLLRSPVNLASSQTFSASSDAPATLKRPEFEVEFSVVARP